MEHCSLCYPITVAHRPPPQAPHTLNMGGAAVVRGSGCGNTVLLGNSPLVKDFPRQGLLGQFCSASLRL